MPEPREEGAEGADAAAEKPRAARPGLSVQRPTFFTRAGVASPAPATTVSPTRTAGRAETVPGAQGVGPATRAALLSGADELARFFGRADSNDFFVPLLITCLNDRAWPLRASFFEHIADVGKFVGRAPCEAFLLPCVERCLSDSSDEVVAWALKCLGDMVGAPSSDSSRSHPEKENQPAPPFDANQHIEGNGSVLQKRSVVAAAQRAAPALCHPAGAIRKSARRFFSAAARFLGRADTFALLLPAVRPFMRDGLSAGLSGSVCAAVDVIGDEDALRAALRPPPSRAAFDAAVASAAGLGNYPHQDGTPMESTPDKAKDLRDRWRSSTTSTTRGNGWGNGFRDRLRVGRVGHRNAGRRRRRELVGGGGGGSRGARRRTYEPSPPVSPFAPHPAIHPSRGGPSSPGGSRRMPPRGASRAPRLPSGARPFHPRGCTRRIRGSCPGAAWSRKGRSTRWRGC